MLVYNWGYIRYELKKTVYDEDADYEIHSLTSNEGNDILM